MTPTPTGWSTPSVYPSLSFSKGSSAIFQHEWWLIGAILAISIAISFVGFAIYRRRK